MSTAAAFGDARLLLLLLLCWQVGALGLGGAATFANALLLLLLLLLLGGIEARD